MAYTGKLTNKPGATQTKKPAVALAYAHRFVTLDTDGFSVVLSTAHDDAIGVTPVAAAAAELVEIVCHGSVLVESGATDIAVGSYVMAGTAGVALLATTGLAVLGRCTGVIGTLASGDLISVDLDQRRSISA